MKAKKAPAEASVQVYLTTAVIVHQSPDKRGVPLYHRDRNAMTHVGDSEAVRSLTQCGERMRFAMAAPIDLRNDFDSVSLRRLAKRTRGATPEPSSAGVGRGLRWWQQDGCVADRRRRSADHSPLGAALQRPRTGRAGRWEVTGRTLEGSTPITAAHQRQVVEAGPVPAVDGVVRWRRKDLVRWLLETFAISGDVTTVWRESEGARLRQDLGAAAPWLRAPRAGRRGF